MVKYILKELLNENEDALKKITRSLIIYLNNRSGNYGVKEKIRLLVLFKDKNGIKEFLMKIDNGDLKDIYSLIYKFEMSPIILIETELEFIKMLIKYEEVVLIDGDYPAYLSSAETSLKEIEEDMNLDLIYRSIERPTGRNVNVAIIGAGIDHNNLYLKNKIDKTINITDEKDGDFIGHGTIMAGIISGNMADSNYKYYQGIAPDVKLIDVKITDKSGIVNISDLLLGLEALLKQDDMPIDIVLFGAVSSIYSDGSDILSTICDKIVSRLKKKIIFIAPAGNNGPDPFTIGSPGAAEKVFCIGSTDLQRRVSLFSSRDKGDNHKPKLNQNNINKQNNAETKPDLVLYGTNIYAPTSSHAILTKYLLNGRVNNTNMVKISGTSLSAALFTGILALIKEQIPQLDFDSLKSYLNHTCDNLYFEKESQGRGFLNILELFKELNIFHPSVISHKKIIDNAFHLTIYFIILMAIILILIKLF
ncbi:MAG: S8 family serine peptidase [Promethearchaeota archaeon]